MTTVVNQSIRKPGRVKTFTLLDEARASIHNILEQSKAMLGHDDYLRLLEDVRDHAHTAFFEESGMAEQYSRECEEREREWAKNPAF